MKLENLLLSVILLFCLANVSFATSFTTGNNLADPFAPEFTIVTVADTIPPIQERFGDHISDPNYNPFDLRDPAVVQKEVEYDPQTDRYIVTERIGDDYFRAPTYMTFEEYLDYRAKEEERAYFDRLAGVGRRDGKLSDREDPLSRIDVSESLKDRLFGGSGVEIRPQGNIDLTFGVDFQRTENPAWTVRQQRTGGFDFDMDIEMSVEASIGEKLKMSTNYNTQATFDFQNTMKLDYDADAFGEDDIIKTIELGNVSFPLRSTLIKGSQNLFGIHTELQFGKLKLGLVASQQKSQQKSIRIEGGSQVQEFEVRADEYDENRHFFLTHFNRDNFEGSLTNLPQIKSLFKVTRLEVWITNDRNEVENIRDIVAIADVGEPRVLTNSMTQYENPPNPPRHLSFDGEPLPGIDLSSGIGANDILTDLSVNAQARQLDDAVATLNSLGFQQSKDYEKVSARLLSPNEYTFNPDLGFVSLNVNLRPDQVLGVAFEYDYNGQTYQVGELTREGSGDNQDGELTVLFVKMLKSTTQRIGEPTWDLMMKNFYNIGAFQVNREDFNFDIFYDDPGKAPKRFIPVRSEDPLLRIFGLDKLNVQGDPCPDGIFDFVPGITINPRNGRIMFPVLEPFGRSLADALANLPNPLFDTAYIYNELYDRTITQAREFTEKNRFIMKGDYKSSVSSEISLGSFNLPEGSVIVRAGGRVLVPNQDYTIDYNIGRVKILNDAVLNSGTPVDISFEDNTLFGFQTRTMLGLRADYEVNKHLNVGGTYMRLFERPFTQKVNVGDDPINNRVLGLDVNYTKEVPFVTKLVDAIPFINTKEPSTVNFTAEVAGLKPSHSKAINVEDGGEKGGTVYIDDFEGTTSNNDLRTPANNWALASVPQYAQDGLGSELFPEAQAIDNLVTGANRALMNWYRIDQTINNNAQGPYTRLIEQDEVFPGRAVQNIGFGTLGTFDLTYYPRRRGPYNFDVPGGLDYEGQQVTAGLDNSGQLLDPESRWGGIMRDLNTNDFQAANIEYLEFWVLNPFMNATDRTTTTEGGELYIDLGNVSEDILRDSRKFFENGIPIDPDVPTDETAWSRIPRTNAVTNAFENNTEDREAQDIGFDGYNSAEESTIYGDWLNAINSSGLTGAAKAAIAADISNDDFVNFRDQSFTDANTVFDRYLKFNNPEGNSGQPQGGVVNSSTNLPDTEDLNNDNTLNETEAYFNYRVEFKPTAVPGPSGEIEIDETDNPFISDVRRVDGTNRVWYRYRIPLNGPDKVAVNGIQDFRSIRFIRMYMTKWRQPVTLRFATLELVRNQWRRYALRGVDTNPCTGNDGCQDNNVSFEINAVNFEENQGKIPFSYQLPPGVQRQRSVNTQFANQFQNEQSLTLEVQKLDPEYSVGAYKIINMDWRLYDRMKMFVHAEAFDDTNLTGIADGDFSLFVRMGSDFEQNYYEYSIPLDMSTDPMELDPYFLWRISNSVDIPLKTFVDAKIKRNAQSFSVTDRYTQDYEYEYQFNPENSNDPILTKTNQVTVKGNPNLGQVKSVMIGLKNNSTEEESIEVWVNELRLTGIDERGGMAALARADINLADFGDITASANYNSIGWGQLEDNVLDRAREETFGYDFTGNAEVGKFFPEDWGLKIPVFGQYSKTVSTPQYDPYDKDLTMEESLSTAQTDEERKEIKERSQDVTEIKSWNVTNLRKERKGGKEDKPKPWNIENFDFTYAYTNTLRTNPIIEKDQEEIREGRINYKYNRKSKPIEPFKKLSKSKYLKLITDFNFDLLPTSFAVSTDLIREFQQTRYRFVNSNDDFSKEFFNKQFRWNRSYDLKWDFTKNLKFNFNARNEAVIDELKEINPDGTKPTEADKRKKIQDGLKDFGRNKFYTHQFGLDYKVPINKLPFLDWVQVKANYNADYSWTAAAMNTEDLGNVIQNNQTRKFDADLDFTKLYKKSKFLAKVDKKSRKKRPNRRGGGKNGKDDKGKNAKKDEVAKKDEKKAKTRKKGEISKGAKMAVRPLLFLRKARLSYSQQFSTIIPGFMPATDLLGLSSNFDAPGWGFVGGLQPNIKPSIGNGESDYLTESSAKGWISSDVFLNQQVIQNSTEQIDLKITLEPFEDFNIDLTANRKFTDNLSLYYKTYEVGGPFGHSLPREFGSYEISFFAMNTLFGDSEELFNEFLDNRTTISKRIGTGQHSVDGTQYTQGYGRTQQNVLLPAFMAAYTGQDANTIEVTGANQNYAKDVLFDKLPNINWQLNYKGLSKLGKLADIFSSFNVTHGYRSTLQVNSFVTNQRFNYDNPVQIYVPNGNFITRFEVPELVINEQFAPLLGLDVRLHNDMTFKVDFKKSRMLALSLQDNSMNETRSDEYVIGWGYRMKDVYIAFLKGGKKKKKGRSRKSKANTKANKNAPGSKNKKEEASDLNFAFDFSYRNNRSFRNAFDNVTTTTEATRGSKTITINPAVDYDISSKLNARLFFDYTRTIPTTTAQFPTTNIAGGVRIRFTLD